MTCDAKTTWDRLTCGALARWQTQTPACDLIVVYLYFSIYFDFYLYSTSTCYAHRKERREGIKVENLFFKLRPTFCKSREIQKPLVKNPTDSDRLKLFAPWYFLHFFICQYFLTQNLQLRTVPVVVLYPYLYICVCILICILRIFLYLYLPASSYPTFPWPMGSSK